MKKVISLALALSMLLCFVACGGSDTKEPEVNPLETYLEENREDFIDRFDLTADNYSDDHTITVSDNSYIISVNVSFMDGEEAEALHDAFLETFTQSFFEENFQDDFDHIKGEVPELESIEVRYCDKQGNLLSSGILK